ncbi:MAG: hypothetical protein MJZ34_14400 [Paludibacteraceae bacterium]|nr:hypothetical protein [Paludibacteraceae bacterium]
MNYKASISRFITSIIKGNFIKYLILILATACSTPHIKNTFISDNSFKENQGPLIDSISNKLFMVGDYAYDIFQVEETDSTLKIPTRKAAIYHKENGNYVPTRDTISSEVLHVGDFIYETYKDYEYYYKAANRNPVTIYETYSYENDKYVLSSDFQINEWVIAGDYGYDIYQAYEVYNTGEEALAFPTSIAIVYHKEKEKYLPSGDTIEIMDRKYWDFIDQDMGIIKIDRSTAGYQFSGTVRTYEEISWLTKGKELYSTGEGLDYTMVYDNFCEDDTDRKDEFIKELSNNGMKICDITIIDTAYVQGNQLIIHTNHITTTIEAPIKFNDDDQIKKQNDEKEIVIDLDK